MEATKKYPEARLSDLVFMFFTLHRTFAGGAENSPPLKTALANSV